MAYAESLFLSAVLLVLVGMRRRWQPWTLALAAGLVTATRPVGVAASAAVLWHIVRDGQGTLTVRIRRALLLAPVTCWGLLGYMGYQQAAFGNALAFAQTQEHWTHGTEGDGSELPGKLWSLATLEPIRGVFDPRSPRYWSLGGWDQNPLFNLFLWNPILFLAAAGLVALGAARRWLSGPEVVFGAALVAIPYVTRSYEMSMASHARFASVVVVIYPVLGRLLASLPAPVASAGLVWSAAMLLSWTALYAAGYVLY